MNEQLIFTVITVSYNCEKFVGETIASILNQTFTNFELIVLDDQSKDNSWEVINSFKDPRITAIRNEQNLGEYANRNKGVDLAKGRYIIFIDGDDIMYHNCLETFNYYVNLFPDCSMVFTREWDSRILYPYKADAKTLYLFEYLDCGLMGGNFTKVMFKKEALAAAGRFPENIATGDTYIQLKIALQNSGVAINDGLTWWRQRKGNATDKFFKNNRYQSETINYRIFFLEHPLCPLDEEEKHIAWNNLYGNYLRNLARMMIKLQWSDMFYLLRKVKVPFKYYFSIFIKSKQNYFNRHSGDNPLHTKPVQ